jgi:hypothetical protein
MRTADASGRRARRCGGRRRQGTTRLATRLGLEDLASDPAWAAYRRMAAAFRRAHCAAIARSVGGGVCGPAPSSIVASAALQLAASRYLFDRADPGSFSAASQLADASRQNLLAAHELAAREALARADREPDAVTREQRDFQARLAAGYPVVDSAPLSAPATPDGSGTVRAAEARPEPATRQDGACPAVVSNTGQVGAP